MIQAKLIEDRNGALRGFLIQGHSGYADRGSDIVCAGVSVLVQAAEEGLERFLSLPPHVETSSDSNDKGVNDADFWVKVLLPESLSKADRRTAEVILGTLEIGLEMCTQEYGKFIILRRCRDDSEAF